MTGLSISGRVMSRLPGLLPPISIFICIFHDFFQFNLNSFDEKWLIITLICIFRDLLIEDDSNF